MEYYFLSVRKIFNSSQKCDSNYCFLKNTKITDLWLANNSVSCFILLPVPCGWKNYFLCILLFRSGASTFQSWLVFWHVNIWLLPQLLKEVKPLALPKILGRAMCSGSTFSWNPPHLALMVYGPIWLCCVSEFFCGYWRYWKFENVLLSEFLPIMDIWKIFTV